VVVARAVFGKYFFFTNDTYHEIDDHIICTKYESERVIEAVGGISRFFSFNITKKLRISSLVARGVKDTQFENQHLLYKLINTTKNNM
jgi:hypothetical protein